MSTINEQQGSIPVKRIKCDSLIIYDVTEGEFEIIKRGSDSILFNISLSLISIFFSFLITIITVDIQSDRKYMFFLFSTILTAIGGVVLFILRIKNKSDFNNTIQKIEKRAKEEDATTILVNNNSLELEVSE